MPPLRSRPGVVEQQRALQGIVEGAMTPEGFRIIQNLTSALAPFSPSGVAAESVQPPPPDRAPSAAPTALQAGAALSGLIPLMMGRGAATKKFGKRMVDSIQKMVRSRKIATETTGRAFDSADRFMRGDIPASEAISMRNAPERSPVQGKLNPMAQRGGNLPNTSPGKADAITPHTGGKTVFSRAKKFNFDLYDNASEIPDDFMTIGNSVELPQSTVDIRMGQGSQAEIVVAKLPNGKFGVFDFFTVIDQETNEVADEILDLLSTHRTLGEATASGAFARQRAVRHVQELTGGVTVSPGSEPTQFPRIRKSAFLELGNLRRGE